MSPYGGDERVRTADPEETVQPIFDEMIERGDDNAKYIWRVGNRKVYYQLFKLFVSGRKA